MIGAERLLVEMHGKSFGGLADYDRLHAGADRAAAVALGDAVAFDQLALAFCGAAAVAAHGGDDERPSLKRLKMLNRGLDDQGDIGDAAAAGGDGDGLPRLYFLAEIQAR